MMSVKGDFPAARTRNQRSSEGTEPAESISTEKASATLSQTSVDIKEEQVKTRRKSSKSKKSKTKQPISVAGAQLIDKFLQGGEKEIGKSSVKNNSGDKLRRERSQSGTVYSNTLVVHPSESETESIHSESDIYVSRSHKETHSGESVSKFLCQVMAGNREDTRIDDSDNMSASVKGHHLGSLSKSMRPDSEIAIGGCVTSCNTMVPVTSTQTPTTSSVLQSSHHGPNAITTTVSSAMASQLHTSKDSHGYKTYDGAASSSTVFPLKESTWNTFYNETVTSGMGTQMVQQVKANVNSAQCPMVFSGQRPINTLSTNEISETTKLLLAVMGVQAELLKVNNKQNEIGARIDGLEYEQEQDFNVTQAHVQAIGHMQDQMKLMGKLLVKQDTEIKSLRTKMRAQDNRAMKSSIKIVGLEVTPEQSAAEVVKAFFTEKMKLGFEPQIIKVNKMQQGDPPPITVTFSDPKQKKAVSEKAINLKGIKNSKNKYYGVFNMLVDEQLETDIRKRQIVRSNNDLPVAQKHKVFLKKGVLTVDDGTYKPKYEKLTTSDLLEMQPEDWARCNVVKVTELQTVQKEGNKFLTQAASITSLDDVRRIYKHMKIKYANAAHVMMAYRLPGTNKAYDEDYYDDGEHGGGRRIFKTILE